MSEVDVVKEPEAVNNAPPASIAETEQVDDESAVSWVTLETICCWWIYGKLLNLVQNLIWI